jgi:hypothetical protein
MEESTSTAAVAPAFEAPIRDAAERHAPSVPSAPTAKLPLASMCSRVDKPFEGVLDRGQGLKAPVHQVPSPETVVTGGGSDVLETGPVQGGSQESYADCSFAARVLGLRGAGSPEARV